MNKPMKKLPQESWEIEFDNRFTTNGVGNELWNSGGVPKADDIKSFIQQTLTSDRQRVVDEIEGMKKEIECEEIDTGIGIDVVEYDGQEWKHTYNKVLEDIIKSLKEMRV